MLSGWFVCSIHFLFHNATLPGFFQIEIDDTSCALFFQNGSPGSVLRSVLIKIFKNRQIDFVDDGGDSLRVDALSGIREDDEPPRKKNGNAGVRSDAVSSLARPEAAMPSQPSPMYEEFRQGPMTDKGLDRMAMDPQPPFGLHQDPLMGPHLRDLEGANDGLPYNALADMSNGAHPYSREDPRPSSRDNVAMSYQGAAGLTPIRQQASPSDGPFRHLMPAASMNSVNPPFDRASMASMGGGMGNMGPVSFPRDHGAGMLYNPFDSIDHTLLYRDRSGNDSSGSAESSNPSAFAPLPLMGPRHPEGVPAQLDRYQSQPQLWHEPRHPPPSDIHQIGYSSGEAGRYSLQGTLDDPPGQNFAHRDSGHPTAMATENAARRQPQEHRHHRHSDTRRRDNRADIREAVAASQASHIAHTRKQVVDDIEYRRALERAADESSRLDPGQDPAAFQERQPCSAGGGRTEDEELLIQLASRQSILDEDRRRIDAQRKYEAELELALRQSEEANAIREEEEARFRESEEELVADLLARSRAEEEELRRREEEVLEQAIVKSLEKGEDVDEDELVAEVVRNSMSESAGGGSDGADPQDTLERVLKLSLEEKEMLESEEEEMLCKAMEWSILESARM